MNPRVWRAWIPAFVCIVGIVAESIGGSMQHTAGPLRWFLEFLLGPMKPETFQFVHEFVRKVGHFFGYSTQALTLYRAWWVTLRLRSSDDGLGWRAMSRAWSGRATMLALLGTLAIAGMDEWHQSFDPTRGGHLSDVVLDEMGAWLAQIVMILSACRFWRKNAVAQPVAEPIRST